MDMPLIFECMNAWGGTPRPKKLRKRLFQKCAANGAAVKQRTGPLFLNFFFEKPGFRLGRPIVGLSCGGDNPSPPGRALLTKLVHNSIDEQSRCIVEANTLTIDRTIPICSMYWGTIGYLCIATARNFQDATPEQYLVLL